jgi:hypothetical protein
LYWEHIVTLQKCLQYILNWPPLSFSFIPSPPILRIVSTGHFSIFIHEYIISPPHSPSYTLSLYLPPPTGTKQGLFYLRVLCFWKKKKKDYFCLFKISIQKKDIYTKKRSVQSVSLWYFHIFIYMYVCIVYQIGSSLPFFSFLLWSSSCGVFNKFKNSVFIFV